MDVITSQTVDQQYTAVCSQLGRAYAQRAALKAELIALDGELARLVDLKRSVEAQYHVLVHNEAAVVHGNGPSVDGAVPGGPVPLHPVKGEPRGN